MDNFLPPEHFLSLPRPGVTHHRVVPDTSTLAAHDFDVDVRTGFMPPQPPLSSLPLQWRPWEVALKDGLARKLKLGDRTDLDERDRTAAETWRQHLREMPILSTEGLTVSEAMLRRAHHVLAYLMHFYIHTLPPYLSAIHIPPSISIPLLRVSSDLVLPPILTYSDNVLYNWDLTTPQSPASQSIEPSHLFSQTTFTRTPSEEHFYLTSARIELAGVAALSLLRSALDEVFVDDTLSFRRISNYLEKLADVIDDMTRILNNVREGCDPRVFYEEVRPWFRGPETRPWIFDGAQDAGLEQPKELFGPSAGQSSLIHVLDIFLGIDQYSHSHIPGGEKQLPSTPASAVAEQGRPFLTRMQSYMPRHHRAFLNHLKSTAQPIRDIVTAENPEASSEEREIRKGLKRSYNKSVSAMKRFRDSHIQVATLYIISQARRVPAWRALDNKGDLRARQLELGTGGTEMIPFLKGVRDNNAAAILED